MLTDNIPRKSTLVLIAFVIATSFIVSPFAIDEFRFIKAKSICRAKGKLESSGEQDVKGYFVSKEFFRGSGFGFYDIADQLLSKRYTYFEIDQDYWTNPYTKLTQPSYWGNILFSDAIGNGSQYYRFYLAEKNSPACAAFYKVIQTHPSQKLPYLRSSGLPVNMCIAAEKTNQLLSRYEKHVNLTRKKYSSGAREWLAHRYITDRETGRMVAEVVSNGYEPSSHRPGFRCPNKDQIEHFDEILRPIADPRLLPKNSIAEIDEPPPFPVSTELDASIVTQQDVNKKITQKELSLLLNPIAEDGAIYFSPSYDKSVTPHTSLSGYYLVIVQSGITKRILVKAFNNTYSNFQGLHINEDNQMVFFGRRMFSSTNENDIAVFRYSYIGEPISVHKIKLPPMLFTGNMVFIVSHVSMKKDIVELTLLDAEQNSNRGADVIREYKLRAVF